MTSIFTKIAILGKTEHSNFSGTLKSLTQYLNSRQLTIYVDEQIAAEDNKLADLSTSREHMLNHAELIIIVGGDGTFLEAGRKFAAANIPLLGINLGRLGFLADISPENMIYYLDEVLSGRYIRDERLMLHCEIWRNNEVIFSNPAINEVVIQKSDVARMISFDTEINGQFISHHRADGLIIATPTGSTAYALSSNGPIVHPNLASISLVPICPHTLSDRPIVIAADSVVEIPVTDGIRNPAQATCDGQINFDLLPGDRLVTKRHQYNLTLLHPTDYQYFDILRSKLGWGRNHTSDEAAR